MAHPRETQAGPAPPRRNPTPGSEALCSPTIYPPGEAQHLLIKNISIMVNDLVSPLIQYDDRCKGKMGVRCCCSMLPAPRCLSASALLHGASSTCQCRKQTTWGFDPWVGKIPWRRAWQPTPVFFFLFFLFLLFLFVILFCSCFFFFVFFSSTPVLLPGESHEQRNLVGHSPQGHRVRHN